MRHSWATTASAFREAYRLCMRAAGPTFWLVGGLQVVAGVAAGAQLLAARELIVTASDPHHAAGSIALTLGALAVLSLIGAVAAVQAAGRRELLTELVQHQATLDVMQAVDAIELAAFDEPAIFDLIERTRNYGSLRALQVVNAASALISSAAAIVSVSASLLIVAPALLALSLVAVLPLLYVGGRNNWTYYRFVYENAMDERRSEYFARLLTSRPAAPELRALAISHSLQEQYVDAQQRLLTELRQVVRRTLRRSSVAVAANVTAVLTAVVLATWMFNTGRLDLANAAIAVLAVMQLRTTLEGFAFQAGQVHEASLFLADLRELDETSRRLARPATPQLESLQSLELQGVEFGYPASTDLAVQEVDLRLGCPEMIAVVGQNGSGKSTLVKIVAGLYPPSSGRLLWNDRVARPGGTQVAVLLQEYGRYWMTLRQNVQLGLAESTDQAALDRVIVDANLGAVIDATERGLETMLSVIGRAHV